MDVIHLLPDSVANQIAAGEVIQRPASCLKELVENALDAGASTIRVLLRDAGKTLIQVIDNGSGMSPTDARMAFERHATSKIRQADDLFTLHTMGFRGEALPSICAVAQVTMTTRREEDDCGTVLEIHGSQVQRQEPCQCPAGTSVSVKNLFFNVPARRRFLKSDQTELRNLIQTFRHIVLVYPDIAFTLVSDDELLYDLTPGTTKQRIEQVFGKSKAKPFTAQLLHIEQQTELATISGFVGKPEAATKQAQQYFFVNGRYMRHPYFHKAVMQAYAGITDAEHLPPYFIYFSIAPELIDVNVHPTKTEIKFADEQTIYPILTATVRAALGKFNVVPSIDFLGGNIDIPVATTEQLQQAHAPQLQMTTGYNPFNQPTRSPRTPDAPTYNTPSVAHWQDLYDGLAERGQAEPAPAADLPVPVTESDTLQLADGTIVCTAGEELLLVHARRAHTLILYTDILRQLHTGSSVSQQLLFPETLTLTPEQRLAYTTLVPILREAGFVIEPEGDMLTINAVPGCITELNASAVLLTMLDAATEQDRTTLPYENMIALTMARSAAIPAGKRLTPDERTDLIRRLFAMPTYRLTPDGKTVTTRLTHSEIQKILN